MLGPFNKKNAQPADGEPKTWEELFEALPEYWKQMHFYASKTAAAHFFDPDTGKMLRHDDVLFKAGESLEKFNLVGFVVTYFDIAHDALTLEGGELNSEERVVVLALAEDAAEKVAQRAGISCPSNITTLVLHQMRTTGNKARRELADALKPE